MSFLEHTINWTKGEILEGTIIIFFGLLLIASGALFWKFGTTVGAKSVVIPLLLTGAIAAISGTGMLWSNNNRLIEFEQRYHEDAAQFIVAEKHRVEQFLPWYPQIKAGITILLAIAMTIMWISDKPLFHGIALGMILLGFSLLVVDYFSKERADTYYAYILEEVKRE